MASIDAQIDGGGDFGGVTDWPGTRNAVPRLFHRIWFGGPPDDPTLREIAASNARLLSGWDVRDWDGEGLPEGLPLRELLPLCEDTGQASDVLRYGLLWLFGGVYADWDVLLLPPFLRAAASVTCLICGPTEHTRIAGENCLLAATPRHPFWAHVVRRLPQWWDRNEMNWRGHADPFHRTMWRTGPHFLAHMVREWREQCRAEGRADDVTMTRAGDVLWVPKHQWLGTASVSMLKAEPGLMAAHAYGARWAAPHVGGARAVGQWGF